MLKWSTVLLLAASLSVPVDASTTQSPTKEACENIAAANRAVLDRRTGELPNGVSYIVQRTPNQSEAIELRLVVRAGSRQEAADQNGVAHLIEHLGFEGTAKFPGTAIRDFAGKNGILWGYGLQAFTGNDSTIYSISLPRSASGELPTAIEILKDWASGINLSNDAIDKQRGVVIAEVRGGADGPIGFEKLVEQDLLGGQAYQRLQTHDATLEKVSYSRVRDFYRHWYAPDRMSVIVVGAGDLAKVECLIGSTFGSIARSDITNGGAALQAKSPLEGANSVLAMRHPSAITPILRAYGFVPRSSRSYAIPLRERYLRDTINELLRLRAAAYADQPPRMFPALLNVETLDPDLHVDGFQAILNLESVEVAPLAGRRVTEFFRSIHDFGFTAAELDRAKDIVHGRIFEARDSNANFANRQVELASESPVSRTPEDRNSRLALLADLSLPEVNQYVKARVNLRKNYHLIVSGDRASSVVENVRRSSVDKAKGRLEYRQSAASLTTLFEKSPGAFAKIETTEDVSRYVRLLRLENAPDIILIRPPVKDYLPPATVSLVGDASPSLRAEMRAAHIVAASGSVSLRPEKNAGERMDALFGDKNVNANFQLDENQWRLVLSGRADSSETLQQLALLATGFEGAGVRISAPTKWRALRTRSGPLDRWDRDIYRSPELSDEADRLIASIGPLNPRLVVISGDIDFDRSAGEASIYAPRSRPDPLTYAKEFDVALPVKEQDRVAINGGGEVSSTLVLSTAIGHSMETEMAAQLLAKIVSQKMRTELRDRLGVAYFFGASSASYQGLGGQGRDVIDLRLTLETDPKSLAVANAAVDKIVIDVRTGQFSDAEFEEARSVILADESIFASPSALIEKAIHDYFEPTPSGSPKFDPVAWLGSIQKRDVADFARKSFGSAAASRMETSK